MLATLKVVHTSCVLLLAWVSNKGINTTMAGNQYRSLASDIIIRIIRLIAIRLHVIQLLRNKNICHSCATKKTSKKKKKWMILISTISIFGSNLLLSKMPCNICEPFNSDNINKMFAPKLLVICKCNAKKINKNSFMTW